LLHPIGVTGDRWLVFGRHRLAACRLLGWSEIPCLQWDFDELRLAIATLDENLIRQELTQLEVGEHLCRREELLLLLGARRTAGRHPKRQQVGSQLKTTKDLGVELKMSDRGVRQAKQIARDINADVKDLIRDTPLADKTTELLRLARLAADQQESIARLLLDGDAKTVREAVTQAHRRHLLQKAAQVAGELKGADDQGIVTGSLLALETMLTDESVDLFLTDPPYGEPDLFGELARIAAAKLKPGGLVCSYSGQYYLPEVLQRMGQHLEYCWIIAVVQSGAHLQVWPRRVNNAWKPILVFGKPPPRNERPMITDVLTGTGCDKRYHRWGQDAGEAVYLLEKVTQPGDFVVDPFVGGGSIPAACKGMGRRWLGTEINPETAELARQRLREMAPGCLGTDSGDRPEAPADAEVASASDAA
jgi:hypothetical protein